MSKAHRPMLSQSSRMALLFCALFLGLLALSHWRGQLAFPEMGALLAGGMGATLILALLLAGAMGRLEALVCWPSALFLALLSWSTLSFAWSVSPADGIDTMGTWVEGYWVFCIALLAWRALAALPAAADSAAPSGGERSPEESGETPPLPPWLSVSPRGVAAAMLFGFLAVVAIASALKGLDQFFFAYDRQLANLDALAPFEDARTRAGIIHAFREKRVGGFFGNPNLHCYVLALGLPFLVGLMASRRRVWAQGAWGMALPVALAAAYLTKSRGGWLCVLLALGLAAVIVGWRRWRELAQPLVFVVCLSAACGVIYALGTAPGEPVPNEPQPAPPAREQVEAGFWQRLTRSSTVRERVYYIEAALRQLRHSPLSPLLGNGLGSYGALYGLTRSEGAGESRFAHNTPLQLLAEGGAPALLLLGALAVVSLAAGVARGRWREWDGETRLPLFGMATVALIVFGVSSLIDFAFYHREFFLDGCFVIGWLAALRQERVEAQAELSAPPAPRRLLSRAAHARGLGRALLVAWVAANAAAGWLFLIQPLRAASAANLGEALAAEGKFDEALREYQRAAALQGNQHRYLDAQAAMCERLGLPEDALRLRARAILLAPYSAYLRRAQAQLLLGLRRFDDAAREAERAIALHPQNPEGHAIKGRTLRAEGRTAEAGQCFERAAQLEPYEPEKYRAEALR